MLEDVMLGWQTEASVGHANSCKRALSDQKTCSQQLPLCGPLCAGIVLRGVWMLGAVSPRH
jgi:hypothetical protein